MTSSRGTDRLHAGAVDIGFRLLQAHPADREAAFADGLAFWRSYYGGALASRLFGRLPGDLRSWVLLMRHAPFEILTGARAVLARRR